MQAARPDTWPFQPATRRVDGFNLKQCREAMIGAAARSALKATLANKCDSTPAKLPRKT
jgi:hypothetical protein